MTDVLDGFAPPYFTDSLVQAERNYVAGIVVSAINAHLSRDDFETALEWFHGGDTNQYEHILELWDEMTAKLS